MSSLASTPRIARCARHGERLGHAAQHLEGEGAQDLGLLRHGQGCEDLRDGLALVVSDGAELVAREAWG